MCRLYEKFLLEYYRKEHPELSANASQIAWQLDDSENQLLPKMQTGKPDIIYVKNFSTITDAKTEEKSDNADKTTEVQKLNLKNSVRAVMSEILVAALFLLDTMSRSRKEKIANGIYERY